MSENKSQELLRIGMATAAQYAEPYELTWGLLSIIERSMRLLTERYPWLGTEDEVFEVIDNALDLAIPHGAELWRLCAADLSIGALPGPGGMADSVEEVVRDAIKEAIEPPVISWVEAVDLADELASPNSEPEISVESESGDGSSKRVFAPDSSHGDGR